MIALSKGSKARLRELERKVERLTPASGPGVLTSRTTRGTSQRTIGSRAAAGSTAKSTIPYWG